MDALTTVGWWEWVSLPGLLAKPIKAKCDTGAATSALHADDLELAMVGHVNVARFRLPDNATTIELPTMSSLSVKSSNGESQNRPVVLLPIEVANHLYAIECTLTDRTPMAYPMLLGRTALAGRFAIDPAQAHVHRKPRARRVQ